MLTFPAHIVACIGANIIAYIVAYTGSSSWCLFASRVKKKKNVWESFGTLVTSGSVSSREPMFVNTVRPCRPLTPSEHRDLRIGWMYHSPDPGRFSSEKLCDSSKPGIRSSTPHTTRPNSSYVRTEPVYQNIKHRICSAPSKVNNERKNWTNNQINAILPRGSYKSHRSEAPDTAKDSLSVPGSVLLKSAVDDEQEYTDFPLLQPRITISRWPSWLLLSNYSSPIYSSPIFIII